MVLKWFRAGVLVLVLLGSLRGWGPGIYPKIFANRRLRHGPGRTGSSWMATSAGRALRRTWRRCKQAGIGGVILMEVDVGIPKGPVPFMSEPWMALFKHAVCEAQRLGLEITLNAGPGWTGSGGPWVKPEQSMQHLVASETQVTGGRRFDGSSGPAAATTAFFRTCSARVGAAAERFLSRRGRAGVSRRRRRGLASPIWTRRPCMCERRIPHNPASNPSFPRRRSIPLCPGAATIARDRIVDLTDRLGPDGRLTWDVPEGNWTILRFGRTTTGANTRPAPQSGLGFECDKFDPAASDAHFEAFVGRLLREVGPQPEHRTSGWTMLHIDSWEMGAQNWTGRFRDEFQRRRGYDPLRYLPVMTGRVVESLEVSERFLWDLRLTAQELVLENHAQHLKDLGRRYGLGLSIEPYDMNPCADLSLGAVADVPMCEFWAQGYGFDSRVQLFRGGLHRPHARPAHRGGGILHVRRQGSLATSSRGS